MKAVVHIGLPKAGSTTVQDFLQLNAKALAKQGFCYRRLDANDTCQREYLSIVFRATDRLFDDPVQSVAAKMRNRSEVADRAAALESWLSDQLAGNDGQTWIISNEFFSSVIMRWDGQTALHDWLSSRFEEVRYILYLRPQDSWAVSMYSQKLRDGFADSFESFLAQTKSRNYDKLTDHWSNIVGAGNLRVRLLDKTALHQGDLIADYCMTSGINLDGLLRPKPRNQSYSRRCASAIRAMNAVVGTVLPRQSTLSRAIRKAGRAMAEVALNSGPALSLTPAQRDAVLAPVTTSNEALRKRWFSDRPTLFDTSPSHLAQAGHPSGVATGAVR